MPKGPKPTLEESFNEVNEDAATQFLRADARRQGLPWHEYCRKWGIEGEAAKRRKRRHETTFSPLASDLNQEQEL
jgi:hypothetical protein